MSTSGSSPGAPLVKLDGRTRERLCKALRDHFDYAKLEQLVSFDLEERLANIVAHDGFENVVFDFVEWAERTSQIDRLLQAACRRSTDPEFRRLARELGVELPEIITPPPPRAPSNLPGANPWPELPGGPHRHPFLVPALLAVPLSLLAAWSTAPLETVMTYARHDELLLDPSEIHRIEDSYKMPVVITFSEKDEPLLRIDGDECPTLGIAENFSPHGRTSWRPVHACVIDALVRAGARTIGVDIQFADAHADLDQPLISALRRARSSSVAIVLRHTGDHHPATEMYRRGLSFCGATDAATQFDVVKYLPLSGKKAIEDHGEKTPALFLQTYSLFASGSFSDSHTLGTRAVVRPEGILYPSGLAQLDKLWLRYAPARLTNYSYTEVLQYARNTSLGREPALHDLVGRRAVFIGAAGTMAGNDFQRIPVPVGPDRQDQEYGVFIQAHAFTDLLAQSLVREAPRWLHYLLIAAAALLSFGAAAFLGTRAPRARGDDPLRAQVLSLRIRVWPLPMMIGPLLVAVMIAAAWSAPLIFPVAAMMLTAIVAGACAGIPAWRVRRRARRLIELVVRAETAQSKLGGAPLFGSAIDDARSGRVLSIVAADLRGAVLMVDALRTLLLTDIAQSRESLLLNALNATPRESCFEILRSHLSSVTNPRRTKPPPEAAVVFAFQLWVLSQTSEWGEALAAELERREKEIHE